MRTVLLRLSVIFVLAVSVLVAVETDRPTPAEAAPDDWMGSVTIDLEIPHALGGSEYKTGTVRIDESGNTSWEAAHFGEWVLAETNVACDPFLMKASNVGSGSGSGNAHVGVTQYGTDPNTEYLIRYYTAQQFYPVESTVWYLGTPIDDTRPDSTCNDSQTQTFFPGAITNPNRTVKAYAPSDAMVLSGSVDYGSNSTVTYRMRRVVCDDSVHSDSDGIGDCTEIDDGTDPYASDTDGDGYDDGEEKTAGTNPKDRNDYPGSDDGEPPRDDGDRDDDGWDNDVETDFGSDPDSDTSVPFAPGDSAAYSRQTRGSGDVAFTCGTARFDWHQVNFSGSFTGVEEGDYACLMMLSNRVTNEALDVVLETGKTMTEVMAVSSLVSFEQTDGIGSLFLEEYLPSIEEIAKGQFLKKISPVVAPTVGRMNGLASLGNLVGLAFASVGGPFLADQIRNNGACSELVLGFGESGQASLAVDLDWQIKYNELGIDDFKRTQLNVWEKKERRLFDKWSPRRINVRCAADGMATIDDQYQTRTVFDNPVSTVVRFGP